MTKIVTIKFDDDLPEEIWFFATQRGCQSFSAEVNRLVRLGLEVEGLKKQGKICIIATAT